MSKAEELALKLYTTPSCGQFGTGDYKPPEVNGGKCGGIYIDRCYMDW